MRAAALRALHADRLGRGLEPHQRLGDDPARGRGAGGVRGRDRRARFAVAGLADHREPPESLAIATAAFLQALREDAGLCYAALEYSSRSNLLLIDRLLDQKLRTAEQRLGQWILLQLSRSQDKSVIRLTYSKRALALELGMTPANLSRLFNVLRDHGVDVDGKTMAITDFEKLRTLAED